MKNLKAIALLFLLAAILGNLKSRAETLVSDGFDPPSGEQMATGDCGPGSWIIADTTNEITNVAVPKMDFEGGLKSLAGKGNEIEFNFSIIYQSAPNAFLTDIEPSWKAPDPGAFRLEPGLFYATGAVSDAGATCFSTPTITFRVRSELLEKRIF